MKKRLIFFFFIGIISLLQGEDKMVYCRVNISKIEAILLVTGFDSEKEIEVIIKNNSQNTIVINNDRFQRNQYLYFENQIGDKGEYFAKTHTQYNLKPKISSFIRIKPGETFSKKIQMSIYENDDRKIVLSKSEGNILFDKDDEIYICFQYKLLESEILVIKENMNNDDYLLENFIITSKLL